ncbi:MAG: PAS domain-containing protein, partial [Candidatus Binatia bacterium]
MAASDDDAEIRAAALKSSQSILLARRRAEDALHAQSELLRVTLASIGDAVISTDAEGRVTFMNGVAEKLTGWSQAEAAGQPLPAVFHLVNESSRLPVENPATKALQAGVVVGLANHTVLIAKDGSERAIDDSAAPIRSQAGDVIGCVLVFRDATETRMAARILQEREAFSRSVFESSPDCVKVLDPEGCLVDMNANGLCLMEIDDFPAWRGRPWDSLWPDAAGENVRAALATARAEGRASFEASCPTAKGTLKWWSVAVAPVRDAQGDLLHYVSVSRDMTERRAMMEALV